MKILLSRSSKKKKKKERNRNARFTMGDSDAAAVTWRNHCNTTRTSTKHVHIQATPSTITHTLH